MDVFDAIGIGFATALTLKNIIYCFVGAFVGTVVGVLPGLGPVATISLLLPFSFTMDITSAIILMAGIFYGAQYGGSITAILVRIPGEASAVVTCLDGYAMARKGRAGAALGIAAFGSFIAGILVTIALFLVGPAMSGVALAFGPAEYTALVLLGLLLVTQLSSGSQTKALLMVSFGLLLSTVGRDPIYGAERFTFGIFSIYDGLNMALLAMGLFGVAELLVMAEGGAQNAIPVAQPTRLSDLLPNAADWRQSIGPILRGTGLGFFLGLLPGGGATLASFSAYVVERRLAKEPERFGQGAIEGVAGPESANNAAAQSSFVPLLSLGIPANAVMAVILGALLVQGITPGPGLIANRPDLFFGVIASMLIGNLMLVVLNVPLISVFVLLLRVPGSIMAPLIIVFCVVGAYTLSNSVAEVVIMIGFGIAGYLMRKIDLDPAPLVLAFVLGNILETNFRQAHAVAVLYPPDRGRPDRGEPCAGRAPARPGIRASQEPGEPMTRGGHFTPRPAAPPSSPPTAGASGSRGCWRRGRHPRSPATRTALWSRAPAVRRRARAPRGRACR
jgi:putative tricarboxylic transport membrane protein